MAIMMKNANAANMAACNVQDFILSASALSSPTLDLSRKGITEFPENLPGCNKLECLYLEGNKLTVLPDSLFTSCPNLRWLDLRNNKLVSIPSSIEKLRYLRTLLLEGNQLTDLPPQLGHLRHLTGLNIAHNPLISPPRHIIERGTKAVLHYLREYLNEMEEGDPDSSDSTAPHNLSKCTVPLHPINNRFSLVANHGHIQQLTGHTKTSPLDGALPLPLMKPATLHRLPEHTEEKTRYKRPDTPSPVHSASLGKARQRRKRRSKVAKAKDIVAANSRKARELSPEEKLEISAAIERQKTLEGLEEWRKEAKDMQRHQEMKVIIEGRLKYPKAMKTAPFATDGEERGKVDQQQPSSAQTRLKEMEGQREMMTTKQHKQQRGTGSRDSMREARVAEVESKVHKYMSELADKRKQAGIISTPSTELLEAERRLAEAMAKRKDVEDMKSREYRLTAFTGDLPLGSY